MINYKTIKTISDHQLRQLYSAVGWVAYTKRINNLTTLLHQANQVISAWDNDQLVGIIRTIGDGAYVELIQDIIVLPDYQHQGIGTTLLNKALNNLPSTIYQIFLLTDSHSSNHKALSFYQQHPRLVSFTDMEVTGFYIKPNQ